VLRGGQMPWLELPAKPEVRQPELRARIAGGIVTMLRAEVAYMHSLAEEETALGRWRKQEQYRPQQNKDDQSLARHYSGIVQLQDWPLVRPPPMATCFLTVLGAPSANAYARRAPAAGDTRRKSCSWLCAVGGVQHAVRMAMRRSLGQSYCCSGRCRLPLGSRGCHCPSFLDTDVP
jgi:hypothetical protein